MSCLSNEERFADLKIIRASQGEELFDLLQPYLDLGWQMTIYNADWAILIKEKRNE